MLPKLHQSCSELVCKWESMVSKEGLCELDVWPYLENLPSDLISRTAFGSSYEEGKDTFQLQKEQANIIVNALRSLYIPGWR